MKSESGQQPEQDAPIAKLSEDNNNSCNTTLDLFIKIHKMIQQNLKICMI